MPEYMKWQIKCGNVNIGYVDAHFICIFIETFAKLNTRTYVYPIIISFYSTTHNSFRTTKLCGVINIE